MKIAIVTNKFPSLSETFIVNQVISLTNQGYNVTVLSHYKTHFRFINTYLVGSKKIKVKTVPLSQAIIWQFIHVVLGFILYPKKLIKFVQHSFNEAKSLKNLIRNILLYLPFLQEYTIVHFSFTGLALNYQSILDYPLRTPCVFVSCRGHAEQIRPLVEQNRSAKLNRLFAAVDCVHCVSQDLLKLCMGYGLLNNKAFVNRPAIELSSFTRSLPYEKRGYDSLIKLINVGRLHWKKGHTQLLLSMKVLKTFGHDFSLTIVGEGDEFEKLVFLIHDLGLQQSVFLVGKKSPDEVRQLLESSDIYTHSSFSEGISNSVIEAMAMELPVISTNVGGMDELIEDRVDGILVPPYEPQIMANKIIELFENPGLRQTIGQNARKKVMADFSLERQVNVFISNYQKFIHD